MQRPYRGFRIEDGALSSGPNRSSERYAIYSVGTLGGLTTGAVETASS